MENLERKKLLKYLFILIAIIFLGYAISFFSGSGFVEEFI